jgi:hypothetical protein
LGQEPKKAEDLTTAERDLTLLSTPEEASTMSKAEELELGSAVLSIPATRKRIDREQAEQEA